jgi:hypothetical protein
MRDRHPVAGGRDAENRLTADAEKRKNLRSTWSCPRGRSGRSTDELTVAEANRRRSITLTDA